MLNILIIDDEKDFCFFVKENLESIGDYNVQAAYTGEDGLISARKDKPDLIILDLLMPKMDGRAVMAELKKDPLTAGIPVLILTALDFVEARRLMPDIPKEAYIAKPVKLLMLKKSIDSAIRHT